MPGDPRIAELRVMGVASHWIKVAEKIGFDAFDALWRILDAEPGLRNENDDIYPYLRPYRSYLRFQRNRFIEALAQQGMTVIDIRLRVLADLCEDVSSRHIYRLVSGL